jgi:hypothetical protein
MRHPTGSKTEDNKWPAGIAQPSVVRGGQFRLWPVYLRPLVTEARRVGVDIEALFRGVPFTSAHLDQPGFTVSHIEAITVVRHSLALFNRPNLGIELGSRSRITDRGALALGIMASPDLGTAMALSLHFPSSAGFLLNLRELRPLGQHVVVAESRLDNQDVAGFLVDKLFAGMVRQRRQISESDASPVFVDLMRAPPASVSGYEQFFRCPVRFNTRSNQLGFDTLRFDAPLPMSNAMSYRLAYRLLERDAEMMAGPSALVLAVMHAVRQALPLVPTPAQIASSLHISERSLRRKLADENLRLPGSAG